MIFQGSRRVGAVSNGYFISCVAFMLLFYGVSVGINITGFALFLHQVGLAKMQIGNVLAMELAGNLLIAPLLPRLSEKFGILKIIIAALIIRNICLIMFATSSTLHMYMVWLFGFGMSGFCLFGSIQYWGTTLLDDSRRAVMLSVMNVAFGSGIAVGVGALFFKTHDISLEIFQLSALFSGLILLPLLLIKKSVPVLVPTNHNVMPSKIINNALIPILCGLVANYILLSLCNFAVLYAIENGVEYHMAILINLYMVAGNLLLTVPIGFVLDKSANKILPLVILLLILCICVALIAFVITSTVLTAIVFVLISAATGSIYVIGLSMISSKFQKQNLAMANTVMLMMNAVGGFAGVSVTGAATAYWGSQGLIISVFVLVFFFLLFVIYSLNNDK